MGFLKNLFKKKVCDFCGGEIGLLGNRKLEDGNMCKDCAAKLSYWFDGRRHATVEEIRQQLAYREENRAKLASFRADKTVGGNHDVMFQLENDIPVAFLVARTSDYVKENADLVPFSQVTAFRVDIEEDKDEQTYVNEEGKRISYNPPRFDYSYDFYVHIDTTNPYFDEISYRLNSATLNYQAVDSVAKPFDPNTCPEYQEYKALSEELQAIFDAGIQGKPLTPAQEPAPAPTPVAPTAWKCVCGTENTGKFCAECGAKKPEAPAQFQCNKCGWQPEDPAKVPKFCPECGDPFDSGDTV